MIVNVTAYKYVATIVGSAIAALGGLFTIMDYMGGNWDAHAGSISTTNLTKINCLDGYMQYNTETGEWTEVRD